MQKLSNEELKRYSRHLVLPGFGIKNQEKLKAGKVLVVGAGGLGCPVLQYLTAAGVGTIGIVDGDVVDLSNLQRQILYTIDDIGKPKAVQAKERLLKLNPNVNFVVHNTIISNENALRILKDYNLIIDGTDNFQTRYLLNDACVLLNKPLVYGAILTYEGQVSVFNYEINYQSYSANYRDLFPNPPEPGTTPNCEEIGVIGVLPGIIGTMQANEAIKILTGNTDVLYNSLLLYDSRSGTTEKISIQNRNSRESIKELIDYEYFCGTGNKTQPSAMKEISVQELQTLKNEGSNFQLIDVREPYEYETGNIGAINIPMSEIPNQIDTLAKDCQVILHCKSGNRSSKIIQWVEKNYGHTNLYNLTGGIKAWVEEIDDSLEID